TTPASGRRGPADRRADEVRVGRRTARKAEPDRRAVRNERQEISQKAEPDRRAPTSCRTARRPRGPGAGGMVAPYAYPFTGSAASLRWPVGTGRPWRPIRPGPAP